MVCPEERAERRQREGSRLDFCKKSHTCQGAEQTVHRLRMCLRLLCKRSACLLPSGEQISQIELGSDPNRFRGLLGAANAAAKLGRDAEAEKYYGQLAARRAPLPGTVP